MIAFRNAVAIASILRVRAGWPEGGWAGASWSETFDHHPAVLRLDGSKFDSWTPALNSIGFRLDELSLTPDLRVPRVDLRFIDERLADCLGRVWHLRYRRKREMRKTAKVFRSLEAAYEALSVGFKNYASLTEVGMDTVHWTTAIEVLASPQTATCRNGTALASSFSHKHSMTLNFVTGDTGSKVLAFDTGPEGWQSALDAWVRLAPVNHVGTVGIAFALGPLGAVVSNLFFSASRGAMRTIRDAGNTIELCWVKVSFTSGRPK